MKKSIILLSIIGLLFSCENLEKDDPVFDYNKKSAKLIETNNAFGLDLFAEIIALEEKPNILISPASISLALGMAYNGSESTTKDEFEHLLNYDGLTRDEVNEITLDLINALIANVKGNTLEIANSIWYHQDFPVYQAFIDLNLTYFDAEVIEKDFGNAKTVDDINKWVKDKTHDKIEKIIEELSPDSRMVLINALYFNCLWETEFDPKETKIEKFYKEDRTEYGEVEMMTTESEFNYMTSGELTAVELPYKNERFSMHLFLPAYGSTLDELIADLDNETWSEWMDSYVLHDKVQVTMPKFKFEYDRELKKNLMDLGLEEAFTDQADFSSISDINLFISKVIHKTFIDVNEEGTEAAAVTAVVMDVTSIGPGEGGPIFVRLDRPFLFAITENSSKSIVFIGKLSEPAYE